MILEGSGLVAPKRFTVRLTKGECQQVLQESKRRAEHRNYRAKSGTWEQGLKREVVIPGVGYLPRDVRPIYAGMLGEYATCLYVNRRFPSLATVDLRLTRYGDFGVDLTVFGFAMQIKLRQSETEHCVLVRRTNRHGGVLSIPARAFVFCEWLGFDTVSLLGWCWRELVLDCQLVQSALGPWKNAIVDDVLLNPMSSLLDELEARKLAGL